MSPNNGLGFDGQKNRCGKSHPKGELKVVLHAFVLYFLSARSDVNREVFFLTLQNKFWAHDFDIS